MTGCGGTARTSGNASGYGLGMQACLLGHSGNGVAGAPDPRMEALGTGAQLFNISSNGTIRVRGSKGAASRRRDCHSAAPPLPLVGVSIGNGRGCQQNDCLAHG